MDVKRDKYLCVDRGQFESLGPWLHGWRETTASSTCNATAADDHAPTLARELLALGILSEGIDGAKDAQPTLYPSAADQMDQDVATLSLRRCAYAPYFFWASARAAGQLRRCTFQSILMYVRARKACNNKRLHPLDFKRTQDRKSVV